MSEHQESWYIRFPDGSLARASGPAMIRKQYIAGRVPPGSQVRRKSEEQWHPVAEHPEFADLRNGNGDGSQGNGSWHDLMLHGEAPAASTVAGRVDPAQMRQPGVRLLLEELLAALDSALVYRKIVLIFLAAFPIWALLVAASLPDVFPPAFAPWREAVVVGGTILGLLLLQAMLTRMTFTELSLMRPARIRDSYSGLCGLWFKSILVQGCSLGLVCAAAWGLGLLPSWILSQSEGASWGEALSGVASCASVLVLAAIWPALLLLAPFVAACVAEEGSLGQAVSQWRRLVRSHRWKTFIAQWLILAIAALLALPLGLLALHLPESGGGQGRLAAQSFLAALAACLITAYFSVANVFLYLHLRYNTR